MIVESFFFFFGQLVILLFFGGITSHSLNIDRFPSDCLDLLGSTCPQPDSEKLISVHPRPKHCRWPITFVSAISIFFLKSTVFKFTPQAKQFFFMCKNKKIIITSRLKFINVQVSYFNMVIEKQIYCIYYKIIESVKPSRHLHIF